MLQFLKKSWLAVSLVLVALSLSVAYAGCGSCAKKKPAKQNQIVLDKIVNELVCQTPSIGFKGNPAPRFGMLAAKKLVAKRGDTYWC
jgi:hypothetical protein